ncbi:hypothetical protein RB653_009582 [Dictyostelium firmibasis]|uniref:Protein kinase domain-containing protein n=1 Tax=Dictyostelium firmibasis TaxID=79012 RepID=A0AAN7TUB6_9MYCE
MIELVHKESQWEILSQLGTGSFGRVVKAKKINCDGTGIIIDICAIKIIKKSVFTKNEIEILKQLDHPLIVKYYGYGVGENDDNIYIYMEYIDGYPISSILKKQPKNHFPEDIISKIVIDLAFILSYIHGDERKIIHRDLKCDNIMLVNDNSHSCEANCSINGGSAKPLNNQLIESCVCNLNGSGTDENCKSCKLNSRPIREIQSSCESCGSDLDEASTSSLPNTTKSTTCRLINCIYSVSKKIKLIDFGLSKGCDGDSKYYSLVGTSTHMPPEVALRNNTACRKSDIWSLGCTIIEMAGGNLFEKDIHGKPKIPDHLSSSCKNFIQRCLTIDPTHRDDIINLISHNFIDRNRVNEEVKVDSKSKIQFDDEFNEVILSGDLDGVTEVVFGFDFNQPIIPGTMSSVKKIEFGGSFNRELLVDSLPSAISITFGARFNNGNKPLVVGAIPSTCQYLTFGWTFNQTIHPRCLPDSLKQLIFLEGGNFNRILEVGSIPRSVTTLILGDYDQKIEKGVLPNSLTTLELGGEFNYPLEGCIPESVTSLSLGYRFNQPLTNNCIPPCCKILKFGLYFNQDLSPGILPQSIETLMLGYYFNKELVEGSLPSSITTLLYEHRDYPKKVHADFYELTNLSKDLDQNEIVPLTPESLPESITKLTIGKNQNHIIAFNCLPPDLQSLKYHGGFSRALIPRDLPSSITSVKLYNYNYEIKKTSFPKSVTSLQLGSRFQKFIQIQSLSNLHQNMRDLKIYIHDDELDIYNLEDIIPQTITSLIINGENIDLPIGVEK